MRIWFLRFNAQKAVMSICGLMEFSIGDVFEYGIYWRVSKKDATQQRQRICLIPVRLIWSDVRLGGEWEWELRGIPKALDFLLLPALDGSCGDEYSVDVCWWLSHHKYWTIVSFLFVPIRSAGYVMTRLSLYHATFSYMDLHFFPLIRQPVFCFTD